MRVEHHGQPDEAFISVEGRLACRLIEQALAGWADKSPEVYGDRVERIRRGSTRERDHYTRFNFNELDERHLVVAGLALDGADKRRAGGLQNRFEALYAGRLIRRVMGAEFMYP